MSQKASLSQETLKGAFWMVLMRGVIRGGSLISLPILARVLDPSDFGLLALATATMALLELFGQFGFDNALIYRQDADRSFFDTAWTLNIIRGLLLAVILLAASGPLAAFLNDPRLEEIFWFLSLSCLLLSCENIGVVKFRREMRFKADFMYMASHRLTATFAAVALALWLQTYWALVFAHTAAALARLLISFFMHSYRPRLSLARWREIMSYSKWLLLNNLLGFLYARFDTFLLGKLSGAGIVGQYMVAHEIAGLPTSEILAPVRRVLFPAYAKAAVSSPETLRTNFTIELGVLVTIATPAAFGLGLLADPIVRLLLGEKWLDSIPLLQILSIYSAFSACSANITPLFMATGALRLITIRFGVVLIFGLPAMSWAALEWGAIGVAWAATAMAAMLLTANLLAVRSQLRLRLLDIFRHWWRSILANAAMAFTVLSARTVLQADDGLSLLIETAALVVLGTATYGLVLIILWLLCGKPPQSPEKQLLRSIHFLKINLLAKGHGPI